LKLTEFAGVKNGGIHVDRTTLMPEKASSRRSGLPDCVSGSLAVLLVFRKA
jgi:hypothetical protein